MAKDIIEFVNETGEDFIEDINNSNSNKFIVRFSNFPNFTGTKLNVNYRAFSARYSLREPRTE